MLIITRKRDQGFFLGDNVKITIREISGDSVRVAIDAPKEIKILREELVEEAVKVNTEAAKQNDISAEDIRQAFIQHD